MALTDIIRTYVSLVVLIHWNSPKNKEILSTESSPQGMVAASLSVCHRTPVSQRLLGLASSRHGNYPLSNIRNMDEIP